MRRGTLFAVVVLVVLSGCTVPGTPGQLDTDRELGSVAGYAADDEFAFGEEATLTEDELEAVTYRSMARLEVIRGLKFERAVDIEVITREEYREQRGEPEAASTFRNEVWRAPFVVDGETDVNDEFEALYGDAVQGYYSSDRIVLVADDSDEIRIDRGTLAHELTHALQDQHFGLDREGETIDERRAELGLIEGEANYLPYLYDERCADEWQCLPDPGTPAELEPGDRPFNLGLFLSIYAPYAEGPAFVSHLHETEGWSAVDRAFDDRPVSTSQVIHPARYPDDEPVDVDVTDRSSDAWDPITDDDGEIRTETIGEATLFGSLWTNGVVDRPLTEGGSELAPYNYTHPTTDGWAGDTLTAYEHTDEETDDNVTAHVWKLAWADAADAEAFADAYRGVLEANGADPVDAGADSDTYRIDDGGFAGAFHVLVDDERVTIVGGPDVDALEEIHATADGDASTDADADVDTDATLEAGGNASANASMAADVDLDVATSADVEVAASVDAPTATGSSLGSAVS
ncbi:Hvo_1808 family surface protein [Natrarchaeobaculum sulfurireducens]|uniref:Uncharacterized protein n=1 Tax=Natrarchaeobaculum sulfurireducens TaxID=2044521 RepID=A0A346PUX1_9EURY|nr:Hvo_1808 family surface protein [Natrarchaeobaculum sulfurireducens]AXR83316.1 hypothetical protein AArcMg_3334 [Natrarchaeobaculum sulfurireducens]